MNSWSWYWLGWFLVSFGFFIVPEVIAITRRHTENTLSAQIWRLEGITPGHGLASWTAGHFLIGGLLVLVLGWLIFHFFLGLFA